MLRYRPLALAVLLVAVFTGAAGASSVMYSMSFTEDTSFATPTGGSFLYDPATGFTDFLVQWDSLTFDLTDHANNYPDFGSGVGCVTGGTGFQNLFGDITGACGTPGWDALVTDVSAGFYVCSKDPTLFGGAPVLCDEKQGGMLTFGTVPLGQSLPLGQAYGTFTVSEAAPEPAAIVLTFPALLAIFFVWRKGQLPA